MEAGKCWKAAHLGDAGAQCDLGYCYADGKGVAKDEVRAVKWYRKAAEQGEATAQYNLGLCYELGKGVGKDEARAAELYRKAAEQGNAHAQCSLGVCYKFGKGVAKDEARGMEWYRKAADQGNADAQFKLGLCYKFGMGVGKDEARAVEWFRKAADQGNADAQFLLGDCYAFGNGVGKDEAQAVEWFRKAADQGDADAQSSLGVCYKRGVGVGKDKRRAVEWYQKAADQGNAAGQYNLGVCYENGTGVGKDEGRAVEWYRKAADQGNADAQCNLGVCYQTGKGMATDEVRAVEWYKKAADQGDAAAQCWLGVCYKHGTGLGKDEARAVEWYQKAADQGFAIAQRNLGLCYEHGEGVDKDEARAVEWYQKAAFQDDATAQNNLGVCYGHGKGVSKNQARAVEWYRQAAKQGDTCAQGNLAEMFAEGLGGLSKDWGEAAKLFKSASEDPEQLGSKLCFAWLLWTGQGVDQDTVRARDLCMQVRSQDGFEERIANDYVAVGEFWPIVLEWFHTTMAMPTAGAAQVASEPQPELLRRLELRLAQLEPLGGAGADLVLTNSQRKQLGRVLGREENLEAIEEERRGIVNDPCMLRYYHALQQALCWMFTGAEACKSGLVNKRHDLVTKGLIQASSKIAGLLPVYGHLAEGVAKTAAKEVADYFAGRNAERIARAGGMDGALVAEGVARYLVFARKRELSSVPKPAYEKGVQKVVKADVERMMKWVKSQSDLDLIREDSDLTGEKVVQRLVVAAEPSWAQSIKLVTPGPTIAAQASGGGSGRSSASDPVPNVENEVLQGYRKELNEVKEQLRKLRLSMPVENTSAFEVAAGGGQALLQVEAQESMSGGSRADALALHQDFAELCAVVDELKGRVDYYERRGFKVW